MNVTETGGTDVVGVSEELEDLDIGAVESEVAGGRDGNETRRDDDDGRDIVGDGVDLSDGTKKH